MAKKNKLRSALSNPSRLKPWDKDRETVQVIIETPKGSRNKYDFDTDQNIFAVKTVLPAGMTFPYDFGFIPSTKAEDGDPTDVLILMDEPAFPGCLVKCRLVGIIEGKQGRKKATERNDRILAVEQGNHSYAHVKRAKDLGKKFMKELEEFFVNYHALEGSKYEILRVKGPAEALRRVKDGIAMQRRSKG
jgi:inorganic pyrophosphatase